MFPNQDSFFSNLEHLLICGQRTIFLNFIFSSEIHLVFNRGLVLLVTHLVAAEVLHVELLIEYYLAEAGELRLVCKCSDTLHKLDLHDQSENLGALTLVLTGADDLNLVPDDLFDGAENLHEEALRFEFKARLLENF